MKLTPNWAKDHKKPVMFQYPNPREVKRLGRFANKTRARLEYLHDELTNHTNRHTEKEMHHMRLEHRALTRLVELIDLEEQRRERVQ